jgi:alpha-mannosidase
VPSVGYAVFDVRAADAPASAGSLRVDATARTLENDQLLVTLNAAGDVAQIRDKRAGRDVLSAPIQLQMFQLGGTGFPQWEIRPDDLVGKKPREAVAGAPTIRVADAGPARVALEITRTQGGSKFVQTVSLASGDAGAVVQVGNHIDWQTHQTLLKAAFPLTSANPKATFGLGVGTIDRGNATGDKYEVPAQHWADLTAPDGSAGAAILSDFKYGWDKPTNDTLRLSLLHTPYVADNTGYQRPYAEQNDLGPHRMTYAIYPHAGTWSAALVDLRAARLSQPLVAVQTAKHEGPLGRTFSLVSVSPARVAIAAVKEAEDSDEVVVRLQELTGAAAPGTKVSFARPITAAREIDGVEKPVGAATVTDGALVTDLPGYDLRAFAVKLAGPPVALTAPSSQPVELPYDVDVVSTRTAKTDGDMDGMGHTFRAELFPQTVTHGAITFKLGPSASKMMNAIAANGQRVALPDGNWNRVYVLAAAIGGEQKGTFRIGDRAVDVTVQDWNAKLATAFNGNDQPETIKRDEVAWTASHRHDARGNADAETHELTNLFQYHFDVPESGDRTLVLPANKNIRVLAVTVARNDNDFAWPADPGFPIGGDHGVIAPPLNGPAPDLAPNQPGDGSSGAAGSIAGSSGSGGGRSGAAGRSGDRADGGAQGDPAAGSTRGGCSCSFTEPSRGGAFVAFATAAAWAWRRRRRRTRSRQRV